MKKNLLKGVAFCTTLLINVDAMAAETAELFFTTAEQTETQAYQRRETVFLQLNDGDLNKEPDKQESVTVLVTSNLENQGSPAHISNISSGRNNVGNGSLKATLVGDLVIGQTWELLALGSDVFLVTGSETGREPENLYLYNDIPYQTSNGGLGLEIEQGNIQFSAGDKLTFTVVPEEVTGEEITLTETSQNSGVFTSSIPLTYDGSVQYADTILNLNAVDKLRAFYTDTANAQSTSEGIVATAYFATTVISGANYAQPTQWDAEGSPYLILGDISVPIGGSLSILAGTEVYLLANQDSREYGRYSDKTEFVVEGAFEVQGTQENPVVIESFETHATKRDWGGIDLYDPEQFAITHAKISNAALGIFYRSYTSGQNITIDELSFTDSFSGLIISYCDVCDISITNSTFENISEETVSTYSNQSDIFFSNNTLRNARNTFFNNFDSVTISENTFENSGEFFIHDVQQTLSFSNNVIQTNRGITITTSYYAEELDSITIVDNLIEGDAYNGLSLNVYSELDGPFVVARNTLCGFGNSGDSYGGEQYFDGAALNIVSEYFVSPTIESNSITQNEGIGVYLYGKVEPVFRNNVISENGAGLVISFASHFETGVFEITDNTISNNTGYGIEVSGNVQPIIQYNDIVGNGSYAIRNLTEYELNARYNWWGEAETAEIANADNPTDVSFIYSPNQASVNYSAWLGSPNALGGVPSSSTVTGKLRFINESGEAPIGFESGDSIRIELTDNDVNTHANLIESIEVVVTSDKENHGEPARISNFVEDRNNVGTGNLQIILNEDSVVTQSWEIIALNDYQFIVTGSVTGPEENKLYIYNSQNKPYTTEDNQLSIIINEGGIPFAAGDKFTFDVVSESFTGEQLTLTETSPNSGRFVGNIIYSTSDDTSNGNGKLEVYKGDRLRAFYYDALNDWGYESVVNTDTYLAKTILLGQSFESDTQWKVEGSPYLVLGDIRVSRHAALKVEAGVEVLFAPQQDNTRKGMHWDKAELFISGALNLMGTEAEPVALRSIRGGEQAGDWGGISLEDLGSLKMSFTKLYHSEFGILANNYEPDAVLEITNSDISYNRRGVAFSSYCQCEGKIVNNIFSNIYGAFLSGTAVQWTIDFSNNSLNNVGLLSLSYLENMTFSNNVVTDAQLLELGGIEGDLVLTNNIFEGIEGLIVGLQHYEGKEFSVVIDNNNISGEGYGGLRINAYNSTLGSIDITGNTISGFGFNRDYGYDSPIYEGAGLLFNANQDTVVNVERNTLVGNLGAGAVFGGNVLPRFNNNTVVRNGLGVQFDYHNYDSDGLFEVSLNTISLNDSDGILISGRSKPTINNNDIADNAGYAIHNNSELDINANLNWWGQTATDEIKLGLFLQNLSFIYDELDNEHSGRVSYAEFKMLPTHDPDEDGFTGQFDNCPLVSNPNQEDFDNDGLGDACDVDDDGDGVVDSEDAFPLDPSEYLDSDNDGLGDNYELSVGLDPYNRDSNGNGVIDSEESLDSLRVIRFVTNVNDLDSDGIEDIVVVYQALNGEITANTVNVASQQVIRNLKFPGEYSEFTVHSFPDMNSNGSHEIGVFGIIEDGETNTGIRSRLMIKDAKTGETVQNYAWPGNWTNVSLVKLRDLNEDGIPEIGMQGLFYIGDRPQLLLKDGATGTAMHKYSFPSLMDNPKYVALSDMNGDGVSEIGLMGRLKANNKIQVKVVSGVDANDKLRAYNFGNDWEDEAWMNLPDIDFDGNEDFALYGRRKESNQVQLFSKSGVSQAGTLGIFSWPTDYVTHEFVKIPDANADGVREVAVAGLRQGSDRYQIIIKNGVDRNDTMYSAGWANNLTDVSFIAIDDFDGDEVVDIGLIGRKSNGALVLSIKNVLNMSVTSLLVGNDWSERPSFVVVPDITSDGLSDVVVYGVDRMGRNRLEVLSYQN